MHLLPNVRLSIVNSWNAKQTQIKKTNCIPKNFSYVLTMKISVSRIRGTNIVFVSETLATSARYVNVLYTRYWNCWYLNENNRKSNVKCRYLNLNILMKIFVSRTTKNIGSKIQIYQQFWQHKPLDGKWICAPIKKSQRLLVECRDLFSWRSS